MPENEAADIQNPAAPHLAVVVSRYNATITDRLLEGAKSEYERRGGRAADLVVIDAPGTFELTSLVSRLALRDDIDGVLALGCVVKGETTHDQHLASAVAAGLTNVSVQTGTPVAFGVLTVENVTQALDRAGGTKGNKGAEAMGALMDTVASNVVIDRGGSQPRSAEHARPDKASGQESTALAESAGPRVARDVRRLAFQTLYQLDVTPDNASAELSLAGAPDVTDSERRRGLELAIEAFQHRAGADQKMTELAPDWPSHRQPAVDRAILRLAHFEITSGRTTPAIAISEAVELAKEFSTERSPAFINALLDAAAGGKKTPVTLPGSES